VGGGMTNSTSTSSITSTTANGVQSTSQPGNNGSTSGLTHTHGSHYFVHGGANTVPPAAAGPQGQAGLAASESSNGRRPSDYIRLRSAIYEKHLKHKVGHRGQQRPHEDPCSQSGTLSSQLCCQYKIIGMFHHEIRCLGPRYLRLLYTHRLLWQWTTSTGITRRASSSCR
jgi:hypothetical protein